MVASEDRAYVIEMLQKYWDIDHHREFSFNGRSNDVIAASLDIKMALRKVEARRRRLLFVHHVVGLTYVEIAVMENLSRRRVRELVEEGMSALTQFMCYG